jgi:dihydroneopterin aldolase
MADRIILSGLTFYGYHGAHQEERQLGQRFVVDVALELDLGRAGRTDDLEATVSYSEVYAIIRDVVEGPPRHLIEAVAEGVATAVLSRTGAEAVTVRLAKPWAPVKGMVAGEAAVEIRRTRS